MRKKLCFRLSVFLILFVFAITGKAESPDQKVLCDSHPQLCTEKNKPTDYEGKYVGHDEPSLLFYSNKTGSGNSNVYFLTLPKDPPILPNQTGTGGTFHFQLHPAFWFGMAICDNESFPNFTKTCVPDTDANIFDNPNLSAPDWMGHHPGTGFMEMQFYPPGWVLWPPGDSCDPDKWCAALNIDSLSENLTNLNNKACLNAAGDEYVNFAFVTNDGVAQDAASPANGSDAKFTPDPNKTFFMNSGDNLQVVLRDTPAGFRVDIFDRTTNTHGSMTASIANGFAHPVFDPSATSCTVTPYAFHPMYATSSEHTRVPWAAHSYNIAFSDEIGHFEYCSGITGLFSPTCPLPDEPLTSPTFDDFFCFGPAASSRIPIGGCFGTDVDFDGPEYGNTWPGTFTNVALDRQFHGQPIRFSSPLFAATSEDLDKLHLRNFSRVAFEADLPRIELLLSPPCNRLTGANCTNPPVPGSFYPIYTTFNSKRLDSCIWQEGGANIPGTINAFGGTSTAEYGPLLLLNYPAAPPAGFIFRFNNFRQILNHNPCRVSEDLIKAVGGEDDDDK